MTIRSLTLLGLGAIFAGPVLAHAATIGSLSDDFDAAAINASNWNIIAADFEAGSGTYTADQTSNPGRLTISGTNNIASFWGGTFLETFDTFDSGQALRVTVDRASIAGAGSARRSSLWIENPNGGGVGNRSYVQFAHNLGENGWQFNNNNTGGGANIGAFDAQDGSTGQHNMQLLYQPLGGNDARVSMFLDGVYGGSTNFGGNWNNTEDFNLRLGGLARAAPGDTVTAQFDNFKSQSFGPLTQTTSVVNNGFAVSNSDLIEGVVPTVVGNINAEEGQTTNNPAALTNGNFGDPGLPGGANVNEVVAIHNNTHLTYDLDLTSAPSGYDITSIDTYAGWRDPGRDAQQYAVLVETVDDPGVFQAVDVVDYNPASGNPSDTKVTIDANAPLATGVSAIRFSFEATENGYVGYREFDVFGVATSSIPEPTSVAIWLLLGLAGAGFGWFRWRKRKAG